MSNHGFAYRERIQGGAVPVLEHLVRRHRHSTEAQWRERIQLGELELDGQPVLADTVLAAGQELVWHRPPWDEPPVDTRFRVLYQDEVLVAVAKPRGLPTLPGGGFLEHTLLAQVRGPFPEASPMHRLGRETSGIVLFSRSHAAGTLIQAAWREHRVVKRYRALASGIALEDSLVITAPIGPVPHPWLGTLFAASPQGKAALSRARVLERRERDTLYQVLIETGRPHQIRIHLAWAGHPLVGDPLYAAGGLPRPDLPALPGDGGYFLHAECLAFPHPVTGAPMELWAPPPSELLMAGEGTTD
jgi:23S rRNA pseudouridine1911/1915/1917 synthase